jgi:hypothetical protein
VLVPSRRAGEGHGRPEKPRGISLCAHVKGSGHARDLLRCPGYPDLPSTFPPAGGQFWAKIFGWYCFGLFGPLERTIRTGMTETISVLLYLAILLTCFIGAVHLFRTRTEADAPGARIAALPEDSKEWFQRVCQAAFRFLEEEFGFRRDPPRLFEPGLQSPYMVFYRSLHLTVVVEGLSHGGRTRMCLIDREGHLLDTTALVKHRDRGMLAECRRARGQSNQIPVFAEALRKCATDVLSGSLEAISRVEKFRSGFSFGLFDSQSDLDDFLKCHGQWRDPEYVTPPAPAPALCSAERTGYMNTSKTPPPVPSKYRTEHIGTAEPSGEKQSMDLEGLPPPAGAARRQEGEQALLGRI